jgi:hypothetical protein
MLLGRDPSSPDAMLQGSLARQRSTRGHRSPEDNRPRRGQTPSPFLAFFLLPPNQPLTPLQLLLTHRARSSLPSCPKESRPFLPIRRHRRRYRHLLDARQDGYRGISRRSSPSCWLYGWEVRRWVGSGVPGTVQPWRSDERWGRLRRRTGRIRCELISPRRPRHLHRPPTQPTELRSSD